MARVLFSCLLLFALSACTFNAHKIAEDQIETAATVNEYVELDAEGEDLVRVWIYAVDRKKTPQPFAGDHEGPVLVAPGARKITLGIRASGRFNRNCPCVSRIELDTTIEPNGNYRGMAQREEGFVYLWLEDLATNEPVTIKLRLRPGR